MVTELLSERERGRGRNPPEHNILRTVLASLYSLTTRHTEMTTNIHSLIVFYFLHIGPLGEDAARLHIAKEVRRKRKAVERREEMK